jgi:DTW domain-containing protein YfiP
VARGRPDLARRCLRCLFPPASCLCRDVPSVATRTRILVLRHASERTRPTNSARWALLALPGARLVDYGAPGDPPDLSALDEPGTAVLFPSPHPPALAPPPRQLVVLDGSWQQARRMIQRIPALRALPRLPLSAARRGPPAMREAPRSGGLSTLEAMAAALELLGEPAAAQALEALHRSAMERAWFLRRAIDVGCVP